MVKISNRFRAVTAGVFILSAYAVLLSTLTINPPVILLIDTISGISVMGVAFLLYPVLKSSGKILSFSYLFLKITEGALMIAAGVFFMFPATSSYRDWIYEGVQLYTFLISALLLYILIYVSGILPRFIAFWGFAAVGIHILSSILGLLSINPAFIAPFLVLMITNELFMAIWLIVKGLRISPVRTGVYKQYE